MRRRLATAAVLVAIAAALSGCGSNGVEIVREFGRSCKGNISSTLTIAFPFNSMTFSCDDFPILEKETR